jgi:Flp pilus assembly protein TadG
LALFARKSCNAGVAALELALIAPFLLVLLVGIADFSIVYHQDLQLASTLAAGAEYAFNKGQNDTGSTLTSEVTSFMNNVSGVPLSTLSVNYHGGTGTTSCYCVNGATPSYTGPVTCGSVCTDGSGSTAGMFVSITAGFSYTALFTVDQVFFSNPITQTVTVRLK